jgi:hypothetical protein
LLKSAQAPWGDENAGGRPLPMTTENPTTQDPTTEMRGTTEKKEKKEKKK